MTRITQMCPVFMGYFATLDADDEQRRGFWSCGGVLKERDHRRWRLLIHILDRVYHTYNLHDTLATVIRHVQGVGAGYTTNRAHGTK